MVTMAQSAANSMVAQHMTHSHGGSHAFTHTFDINTELYKSVSPFMLEKKEVCLGAGGLPGGVEGAKSMTPLAYMPRNVLTVLLSS